MTTYTADDFVKARFAELSNGAFAARLTHRWDTPWVTEGSYLTDAEMAADGWVPFPEPRPLPVEVTDEMVGRGMEGWNSAEGQTFVTAIRAVLTAALAAAPTTDEDVHVAGSRASLGSLVEQVRDGGSRCQVDRVVIAPCDEYGSTDTELRLYAERDRLFARCEEIIAEHERADAARAEAAEARVAELRAEQSRPLTPDVIDDEMVQRLRDEERALGLASVSSEEIARLLLTAALTEPPKRPKGAEEWEEWLSRLDYLHDETGASRVDLVVLANDLGERGVRATEDGEER